MRVLYVPFWVMALVAGLTGSSRGQSRIVGTVYDSLVSRAPMEGATVVLVELARYATTDRRGQFFFEDVPAGRYSLGLLHAALDSFDLSLPPRLVDVKANAAIEVKLTTPSAETALRLGCAGDSTRLNNASEVVEALRRERACRELARLASRHSGVGPSGVLSPRSSSGAQPMQAVVVRERQQENTLFAKEGFFERARLGLGGFATPEMISKHSYGSLELLLAPMRGVRVEYATSGLPAIYLRGGPASRCVPAFFVDGALAYIPFGGTGVSTPSGHSARAAAYAFREIAARAPPQDVRAVEVYPSAGGIPIQFDYTSVIGCGSVVIWTR